MSSRDPHAYFDIVPSPVGDLLLTGDGEALTGLYFRASPASRRVPAGRRREPAAFAEAADQLGAYFAGERTAFDLPLAPPGTAFQRAVWRAVTGIPYGETRTYGELAATLGRPGSARAVGAANGRNPIAIVVPCHRVIGADRTLTGYAGGLDAKRTLLRLEGVAVPA
ncbi:MAG TPA: methylated-DNA--[protein]-cysteine S-methyltransferase [Acidimicrobiales bacterium]